MEAHRAGRLAAAAKLYCQVLEAQPGQTDALHLLGVIAHQTGHHAQAVELMRQSLALQPDQPQCHNALGLALMQTGDLDEAAASFARAIAAQPAAEFYNNLGNLRGRQERHGEAIDAYRQAVALQPDFADAHYNLGNAYRSDHQPDSALAAFRRALDLEPNHANALAALGQMLESLDRFAEALPFLERAISLVRDDAALYCDAGDALQKLGRRREAVARYQQALRIDPRLARAWFAAGCAESADEDYASATLCFRKAVEAAPDWPEAHHNLGDALFSLGQADEALDHLRQAAAADSEFARAMIAVVIPGAPHSRNQDILNARRQWAERDLPPPRPAARFPGRSLRGDRRLRIGYVSSFFHRPNWMKPVWGLINQHDRSRFRVHLFSDSPREAILHGYRAHTEDWFHDISALSSTKAADLIEKMEIDILVDLNAYSKPRRLEIFALRPAPLAVAWFNMHATSGMTAFDCLVGDAEVIPPEEERFYTEKVARVTGSYLSFEVAYPVPAVAEPPCLATGAITFGCLASQYKVSSEVVAAWSAILEQAPASRLILRNSALGAPEVRRFVHDLFARHGISPERVRLLGPADHAQFLETYDHIDLALETFPYNGGTTTTEAIWQGVPVITFWGDRWLSRTAASILRAGNLHEFVLDSAEDYVALAIRLANSHGTPAYLAELRRSMRARLLASPVCDTRGLARQMEDLYRRLAGE